MSYRGEMNKTSYVICSHSVLKIIGIDFPDSLILSEKASYDRMLIQFFYKIGWINKIG
jgi:hypothetical protein